MIRYHNRILTLPDHRLPKMVYEWEAREGGKGWIKEVGDICKKLHLPDPGDRVIYDMDNVQVAAHKYSIDRWWHSAQQQPKLQTYIEVRPQDEPTAVVKCNLKRYPRSLLSRLLCGILPLEVEVGRFTDIPKELRLCKTCN